MSGAEPRLDVSISTPQLSAALTLDAVTTVTRGLNDFLRQDPNVLRNTFRRGQIDRKSNTGSSCRTGTPSPWPYGSAFMKTLKQVSQSVSPSSSPSDSIQSVNIDRMALYKEAMDWRNSLEWPSHAGLRKPLDQPVICNEADC